MNIQTQEITFDINDSKTYETMYSKQYDEGRQVVFHITKDGQPFDTTGYKVTFQMKKPDKTVVINDYDISNGTFTVTLTNQMTICAGNRIPFQIQLIKVMEDVTETPLVLTTVTGYLKVAESVIHPDDVVSSDEFNALTHALIEAEELQISVTRAEELRQYNEETRQSQETERQTSEQNRQSQETERQTNEALRISEENTRCQNEETRQSNENLRISNETTRQYNTADAIEKSLAATANCLNAVTELQAKLDAHHFVLTSDKGIDGGVAELDENGLVPASQLPSYVDDVVEGHFMGSRFYAEAEHSNEIPGETGKVYVDLNTNKTYRWSGSTFIVISETLALGETSSTAYRGDRGKAAYDHSQEEHARIDATKVEASGHNGTIRINDTEISVYVHPNSITTAGSYGDASDQAPAAGESFKVPYVTVDTMGHVTEASEHTVTLPFTPITVDCTLSTESANPVENKVITEELANKQNNITGAASTITSNNLTASRALISNSNGKVAESSTTLTELEYLHGVTDAIQTQLNNKLALSGGTMTGPLYAHKGLGTTDLAISKNCRIILYDTDNSFGSIRQYGNQQFIIRPSAENDYGVWFGVREGAWNVAAETNNYYNLGSNAYRWRNIFTTNPVNVTSDRNLKDNIHYMEDNDVYVQFLMKLLPCSFTYKNIDENDDHDRTHIGFIAQDVESAMKELGLTSFDFAGLCKDKKTINKHVKKNEIDKETGEEKEIEEIIEEVIDDEYIYSLRYQEFIAIITKALQQSFKKLDELDCRLSQIENKLNA